MAHLWVESPSAWSILPLARDVVAFDAGGKPRDNESPMDRATPAAIVRARGDGAVEWVLVVPADACGVRINGRPMPLRVRVLADRDELGIGAATYYFSTETLPVIGPFEGAEPVTCPRCKTAIAPAELSVECPGCRTRYHQHDTRPCWLYAPACALCGRATALDQPYAWTPAEL